MKIRLIIALSLLLIPALTGCDTHFTNEVEVIETPPVEFISFVGSGIGLTCQEDDGCRDGLRCDGNVCCPMEDRPRDSKCLMTAECAAGLHCSWAGFCVPSGSKLVGDACSSSAECERGLFCDLQGLSGYCTATPDYTLFACGAGGQGLDGDVPADGEGQLGEPCSDSGACAASLACLSGVCASLGDLDYPCDSTADCLAGLQCSKDSSTCVPGSLLLFPDLFKGELCRPQDEASMDFGIRMAVPGTEGHQDYYSFPFPTDYHRTESGSANVTEHPVPGPGLIGFDPIGLIKESLDRQKFGWSPLTAVTFRASAEVDPTSLVAGQTTLLVNLTTGETHPSTVVYEVPRNKYSCGNRIIVQPVLAQPLDQESTYAALITTDVLAKAGVDGAPGASASPMDSMAALLSSTAPSDVEEAEAWSAFEPLRIWLGQGGSSLSGRIAGAAVFTVGVPTNVMADVRQAVGDYYLANHADPTDCDLTKVGGNPLNCPVRFLNRCEASDPTKEIVLRTACGTWGYQVTGAERDPRWCPYDSGSSEYDALPYHEYHALMKVPKVQQGQRPYLEADGEASGGLNTTEDGELDGANLPSEEICVSITVPKGAAPAAGWPVLIYGHGTGGGFRTGTKLLGSALSDLSVVGHPGKGMVVVSYDLPMHHLRRGDPEGGDYDYAQNPGPLFYNFKNPVAARANYYQGAADVFALTRLVADLYLGYADRDLEQQFVIDVSKLAYHGHSQGGGQGPLVGPFEPDLKAIVLSGTGGGTVEGLLRKTQPYDASIGVRIMLQELEASAAHPALQLLQQYYDPIDPAIYGPLFADAETHLLHVVGATDNYTPPIAMATFAGAADTDLVTPAAPAFWFDTMTSLGVKTVGAPSASAPLEPNRSVGGRMYARYAIQHPPCATETSLCEESQVASPPFDGHFTIYQNQEALLRTLGFLATWLDDGTPQVIAAP